MIDRDYNRRQFDGFCDQAAEIGRSCAVASTLEGAVGDGANRMRHLTYRAVRRGMDHEQLDAIGRAFARAFSEAWSHLEIKRTGGA